MDTSAMPKPFSTHHDWYLNTLAVAADETISSSSSWASSRLVYSYGNAINGFAATLSPSELEAVRRSPGYLSSVKDREVQLDTTHSYRFLGLDSDHGAWSESDSGSDVIVGVVDTGVWPESRSFNDDGMGEIPRRWNGICEVGVRFNSSNCNRKLVGARYFNKGLLAGNPKLKISMNSARDTDGHGTHTSSTAGGSRTGGASYFGYAAGVARGAAPKSRVAIYKALWAEGNAVSDIIAAVDQAIIDGVDVLSMSLGINGVKLYEDPIAIASFAAAENGIFVSTSAGNNGPGRGTLHNGTPWVLTVAAGTIDREFRGRLTLGNGIELSGQTLYLGNYSTAAVPLFYAGECDKIGKQRREIVVCVDRTGSLGNQFSYLRDAEVAGGVFISNDSDTQSYIQTSFPALFFSPEQGREILGYLRNSTNPKAAFTKFAETAVGTTPAPKLTSYSSRGPSFSSPAVLKPDVLAPGDLIIASWPPKIPITALQSTDLFNKFNILSGTSMSCPHAAGVAALIKSQKPSWSPAAIRSAMMTTSSDLDNTGEPIKDSGINNEFANPFGIGSGHINPTRALNPGLIYDAGTEDYINLLCGLNFTARQIKTIARSKPRSCSKPSLDLNYPSFIAYFDGNGGGKTVKAFRRTVTNVGDVDSVYVARLSKFNGVNLTVSPERLEFDEKHRKRRFTVRIEGRKRSINSVIYGYLTWVDTNGKYTVKTPIVITK
ncbi:subtilisin-like protease preproenzyme [Genlisea aurea]|uniref:Subtilisin-like protease preproenzyme n=1 Tax=Genlisea aurea TaxID=192259 RepID=S8C841_9LAMI|nr:subtilisin-like protease preproenzyme [Genlisea aurea]